MTETILTNATLVLRTETVRGTVVMHDSRIHAIDTGRSHALPAIDCEGDVIIPGVIDLHTDNLERQVQPRILARWPSRSAFLAHDAQCAAAGVTTIFDSLCLGDLGFDESRMRTFRDGVEDLDALADTRHLKGEHFLHLRCEMPAKDVLDMLLPVAGHARVRMLSLMDHSPGVGQYSNIDRYRAMRLKSGTPADAIERRIQELLDQRARLRTPNRKAILAAVAGRVASGEITLASHDDETEAEIAENHADGIRISEFPVTLHAAAAARAHGMTVIAGAPNIVRGGSHSGNVNAANLVRAGNVDAFASDYVPAALVEAAFICADTTGISLPDAVAMITDNPARMAGLADRGRLEAGLRADVVRVDRHENIPVIRQVYRAGERVA